MSSNDGGSSEHVPYRSASSFELAARVVVLGATNLAACCVALYVFTRHSYRRKQYATIGTLCAAYVSMVVQTGTLVAACSAGWGSDVDALSDGLVGRATRLFFASNLMLVLALGFSRASVCASLWQANQQTKYTKYTVALLGVLLLWIIGSLIGMILNRVLPNAEFWEPARDCNFALWACIVATGLAIDLVIAGISISLIAGLQMSFAKKLYAISVFGVGILANVPFLYGISYLYRHSSQIESNPTSYSASFIYANQAAIAVSFWCRALEAARHLQRDVGHATWGHENTVADGKYGSQNYYAPNSFKQSHLNSRGRPREEDEMELRPVGKRTNYTASIKAADNESWEPPHQDIEVTKQVWVR